MSLALFSWLLTCVPETRDLDARTPAAGHIGPDGGSLAVPAPLPRPGCVYLLFFASGFTALVYEVLWIRDLGRLFGNAAHSTAATVAVFFLGLATGARFWGRGADRARRPLRTYALLETGVAATALAYLFLPDAWSLVYASLSSALEDRPAAFLVVKLLLAGAILFPPAFFLGGTWPMMSAHLAREASTLGRVATSLYSWNTLGGGLGAYAAGFLLPIHFGFRTSYALAVALTTAVALAACVLSMREAPLDEGRKTLAEDPPPPPSAAPAGAPAWVRGLAFQSGFVTLALQVLWTRMFAQVLDNSVYSFSAILVTFLVALAAGAGAAHGLARTRLPPVTVLYGLLLASAFLVALSPDGCGAATHGLMSVGGDEDWAAYTKAVFALIAWVILPPTLALGGVFPWLMKVAETSARSVGRAVGDLSAANTAGAITGSLVAGFVLLDLLGLWNGIRAIAAVQFAAAIGVAVGLPGRRRLAYAAVPACALLLLPALPSGERLPAVRFAAGVETLVEVREGAAATVAVLRRAGELRMVVNRHYTLGTTSRRAGDERQAHLPLLIHPGPRSVFFLGMGPGFTAGAALLHAPPVERVRVCEILPEVIAAARGHFRPYVHGLFEDLRVQIVAEDGRNRLRGTRERFDVIVGDLFFPWDAGAGDLYALEHFRAVRERLQERGLFAQWLPLYQLSRREFDIVARTLLEVFPLVTLWRGDFYADEPILALVGHREVEALDPEALCARLRPAGAAEGGAAPLQNLAHGVEEAAGEGRAPASDMARLLLYYCGNLTQARDLFRAAPLNTDDHPVIEYAAPVTHRRQHAGKAQWMIGSVLVRFLEDLSRAAPIADDPYLRRITPELRETIRAGFHLYRSEALRAEGEVAPSAAERGEYEHRVGK